MKSQFDKEDILFKDACEQGIYMLDREKNKVNRIRHIRCYAPSVKNPLEVKRQTYLSSKEYRNSYYASVGDLYVMCRYQSEDLKETEIQIYSLFDISQNRQNGLPDIPYTIESKKHQTLHLKLITKAGDMVLVYQNSAMELRDLDTSMLSDRLFVVGGFENDGCRITLKSHLNALDDKDLGKGESIKDFKKLPQKIRCGAKKLKFLQEGIDFRLTDHGIEFMNGIYD